MTYEEIAGADHFSIMNEMLAPQGRITTLIRQLFERTAALSRHLRGAKRPNQPIHRACS